MKTKGMPGFTETLDSMLQLHIKKNRDYAGTEAENPFFNFDVTAEMIRHFTNPKDQVYAWPIINKLARLAILLSTGKNPDNESVQDSLMDIAIYAVIWKCDISRR